MKRSTIIELMKNFEESELPSLVERELTITPSTERKAIVFIGPRRAGKTCFCFQIMKNLEKSGISRDRMLYINLEDDRLQPLELSDLDTLLRTYFELHPRNKQHEVHLFLDEVQNVTGWERFVRRVLDTENIQIYLTGSSSKLLSTEIATSMRGRSLSYSIFPFSYREYLTAKGIEHREHLSSTKKAEMKSVLSDYLETGGFPEITLEHDRTIAARILRDYVDVMLFRDVVERFSVKNVPALKSLFRALVSSTSTTFSTNKVYNDLKSHGRSVGKNTLYEYTGYLEDVYAIRLLRAFSYSARTSELSLPKPYPIDPAMLRMHSTTFSENMGIAMENVIAIELFRRCSREIGTSIFYWKDTGQREVDFVLKREERISELIQVCYDLHEDKTAEREIRSLVAAAQALDCTALTVVTWDEDEVRHVKGHKITFVPLWKWLLGFEIR